MVDTIADTLARIKNGLSRKKESVMVIDTKMNRSIVEVLKKEAFVEDFEVTEEGLKVVLKYVDGQSVVSELNRVSKPGQRVYVTKKEILPVMNGRGISIISTSNGVMAGAQAKAKGYGGEFICKVW